ncbi:hypothetical protein MAR_016125 [Mya arenaria]|uniref:Uncharacterized protein n=1 Tax=Mya arenaria TaxID=6604 RepID=A0ABY7FSH1_MYAAR|nr:hypothetical protein MAR_016125 [Mya arenaria]
MLKRDIMFTSALKVTVLSIAHINMKINKYKYGGLLHSCNKIGDTFMSHLQIVINCSVLIRTTFLSHNFTQDVDVQLLQIAQQ